MTKVQAFTCSSCERAIDKPPLRSHNELHYCDWCVRSKFTHTNCRQCSKPYRMAPNDTDGTCPVCTKQAGWMGKRCSRCTRVVLKNGRRIPDGRISCNSCLPYFAPLKECHYCHGKFQVVSRYHIKGVLEPACGKCMYKIARTRTCAGCHRPRAIAGERDGRGFCLACLPTGHPPIITCSDCHQRKYHFGAGRCDDCAWQRIQARLLRKLSPSIRDLWARELFEDYYRLMVTGMRSGVINGSLKRDAPFFSALSTNFVNRTELTGVLVVRRLGHQMVRHHSRVMSFLNSRGVIMTVGDPDYELEYHISRIRELTSTQAPWMNSLLQKFLTHLLNVRDRFDNNLERHRAPTRPKSIESAIRSASDLLQLAASKNACSANEITQDHLDLLIGRNQRHRMSCASFVRYLNKHEPMFKKLRIPGRSTSFSMRGLLGQEKRDELIAFFSSATDTADMRWSLCALLALIYAQPPARIVRMHLDQVREGAQGGHEIKFMEIWIALDATTSKLLSRWLSLERRETSAFERDGASQYLFPGRRAAAHANSVSFGHWLKRKTGVGTRALMKTSLTGWISSSLNTHRVVIDALGVSRVTTAKYAQALGVQEAKMAQHAMTRSRSRRR